MKDKKTYSYPTDHMLTVGLGLSIFYWLCEFFISMLSTHHGNTLVQLFGKSIDDVWTRIVVLCLFMIFGSHAQYTIDKRKKAEESLRRQNEYMEALHETALGLIRRLELNDLLQAIINRATSLTRIPNGFIYLYNAEQGELEMKVGTGIFADHTGLRLKPGDGLAGKVWLKKESIIINNYQSLPEKIGLSDFNSIRCIMAIPLKSERGADGVMGLCHTEKGQFIDSESAEMSERFSKLASVALYNARLYTDMQHELERRKQAEKDSREMENQLRRSQKMEALGTLAGGIAHDFNNILSAIIGFAEMAMMYDAPEGSKANTHIRQVVKAGLRARDLVRQILTFSRESRQDKQIIHISSALKEVLHLLRASLPSNIDIRREIAEDAGCILADPTEIHQIIMNLCTNAAHAMEDSGGIMTVSLANLFCDGDYVSLKIRDTGCGISPDIIEKVFDPYFTTKEPGKGTGLGLAIVNNIVEAHEGKISIDSNAGKGTIVSIFFPILNRDSAD
jgi:signal transduction histidine kinase